MDSFLKDKRILIFQQRNWGVKIGHFLAKKMQSEGARLAALTFKKNTHRFTLKQKDVKYEMIINDDEVAENPKRFLGTGKYTLNDVCEALGIHSIWPLVGSLRHYAFSYKDKYFYAFRQNMSDEEIVTYILAVFEYAKKFFDKFQPDVIIAPALGDLRHVMFNLMAEKRGIKMLSITDVKVRNVLVFNYSYLDDKGPFHDRLDALNSGKVNSPNRDKARKYLAEFREVFKRPSYMEHLYKRKSAWKRVKQELRPYYYVLRWFRDRPQNAAQRLGITPDSQTPRFILRDHYAAKRYQKFADTFKYFPLDQLEEFVYFPLQFQPEPPIDLMAPHFSNQIETARQVAMSLPGSYTLAVREHPAFVGKRPPSYYKKLDRIPNAKLIDYRIPSSEVLKKSALVISPGGTTVAEAAIYRKPVIQLGNLGTTLKLPYVFQHTDLTTLSNKINELLVSEFDTEECEQRLENFVAAAYDIGFDFQYLEVWHRGKKAELDKLWWLYRDELARVFGDK